jgi:hypothetical protein
VLEFSHDGATNNETTMMTAISSTTASAAEDCTGSTAVAASLYLSIEASMLNNSGTSDMELLSRKRTASEEVTARAAATAARRKRRRALVRRTHSPKSAVRVLEHRNRFRSAHTPPIPSAYSHHFFDIFFPNRQSLEIVQSAASRKATGTHNRTPGPR